MVYVLKGAVQMKLQDNLECRVQMQTTWVDGDRGGGRGMVFGTPYRHTKKYKKKFKIKMFHNKNPAYGRH